MFDFKESTSSQRKASPAPSRRFVYKCLLGFETSLTKSVGLLLKCFWKMVSCQLQRKILIYADKYLVIFFVNVISGN